jgi:hypothetical protein
VCKLNLKSSPDAISLFKGKKSTGKIKKSLSFEMTPKTSAFRLEYAGSGQKRDKKRWEKSFLPAMDPSASPKLW